MNISGFFAPYEDLADRLIREAIGPSTDASHDLSHVKRVWKNVRDISAQEGGAGDILIAATVLHDCVEVPKDSPTRSMASRLSAEKALRHLDQFGWSEDKAMSVAHAIEAHSFSAGIMPRTLEAKILQDADRLDAIGYVGIARCFYVSGRLHRELYDSDDPQAAARALDDSRFALDHFQTKLLKLAGSFQTETGRAFAQDRHSIVEGFMKGLIAEVS
jgi:uncharacterized protein